MIKDGNIGNLLLPYFAGLVAAGIETYFSYKWLSSLVQKHILVYNLKKSLI